MINLTAVSAASLSHASLFTAASGGSASAKLTTAIDDCGTLVPHKVPGGGNPPPPPPFGELAHFAGVSLQAPTYDEGDWCGTVPHKLPGLGNPPPPPPWIDGINAMLGSR